MVAVVSISLPSAGCITVDTEDGAPLLRLTGEIDAETVSAYERCHGPVPGAVIEVDLTDVRFLSSSAVAFLIQQTRPIRDRGQLPTLRGVSSHARRVLELIGALELFALPS
jgi:anti-anti-sigma factor